MDKKNKNCCPNCSQFYHLKSLSPGNHGNIPLFLNCGHTMCENCIKNIVKFEEPIQCKVCEKDMEVDAGDIAVLLQNKLDLYKLFPINTNMLGELVREQIEPKSGETNKDGNDYFTEIRNIVKDPEKVKDKCMECHNPTPKFCKQCGTTLCMSCFNKIHKNFVVFKHHTLEDIASVVTTNTCQLHKDKPLDYYCKDCSKSICMDCMMVGGEKSCKSHDVVSMQDMNEILLESLTDITPKVDETYKRLTKTAVDIGHLIYNIENNAGTMELTKVIQDVNQHFSKLLMKIQKHKDEVKDIITKLQSTETESLDSAKNEVATAIKEAKRVLNDIKSLNEKNLKQANVSSILEEANKVIAAPWYLYKDDTNKDLKVTVNEDLINLLNDYIHLDGNTSTKYKLLGTDELTEKKIDIPTPPAAVVYPPELPKDVRQKVKKAPSSASSKDNEPIRALYTQVPTYRTKSGSCSSINSLGSDDSRYKSVVQQVNPFPESQHPKQLTEGSQELIYLSHIVDPHNFFVQRACLQPQVQELIREFRTAVSLPKPPLSRVAEGKFYLAFNKADNMWQRCRVVSIDKKDANNPHFHVFCIDFGSTEIVTIDKLRYLPPARVQTPPPFAINCSLANSQPVGDTWNSEDAFFMQNVINNKQAVIHIRRIRSTSNYTIMYECDVITYEDGVNLALALEYHGRSNMPNPKLPYPRFKCGAERLKIYGSISDFPPNTIVDVDITYIACPDNFYVRKHHLQGVFKKLCEEMEQEYSLNVQTGMVYHPEPGMVVAVNVERNMDSPYATEAALALGAVVGAGGWARGVVRDVPSRDCARVWLPDVGPTLIVNWNALRRLHPQFATLRALAAECHVAGVTPLNRRWGSGSICLLQHFEKNVLEMHVEDTTRDSLGVTLYDKTNPDDVLCVNQQLVKHKFAVSFGEYLIQKDQINNQVYTDRTPLDRQFDQKEPKKQNVKLMRRATRQRQERPEMSEVDLEAKDKGPLRLEIKILHYQSPSLFYVSLIHQQKTFKELSDKMQKYYTKRQDASQGKNTWQVGDRCCTICLLTQTWRRAAILEIDGDNVKVFYSDFASVETVPILSLRELTKDFASIGDAAFKCHLCGVIPAVGDEWPSLTKEYLKELIDAYRRIFITKIGNFKDKSMPVELWVYHTVQGGALEPNTSEWRCLNKKIIEQGLGIPDKNQEFSDAQKKNENVDDNILSFLNLTGSVNEWLQLEQLPMKPIDKTKFTTSDDESNSHPPTPVDDLDTTNESSENNKNTVFITDWQPPEPLPSDEFLGMPTYIDNNGVIYLHNIEQQETLDLIRQALDVRFKKPDPKAKFAKWTSGEPCIALYYLDSRFYRGRVRAVNAEESKCLIHYIDYGNEETCAYKNMRKSIALYQIPVQAHKCVLARIRPVGNVWNRQTLDYIHKSIVEKKCFIKVSGPAVEGVIPIELKFNKLWINDHLVEFEMAVYTDGSKAVSQKFAFGKNESTEEEPHTAESDSGPDYILEDENSTQNKSNDSFNMESLRGKDWNELLEEQDKAEKNVFLTYSKPSKDEFYCNIMYIYGANILQLTILHDENEAKIYKDMFEKLQTDADKMPQLDGVFEHKPCIAKFDVDEKWYRAIIMQYDAQTKTVKVKYVDYGNVEVIPLSNIKEINEEYVKLPPATVTANLYKIKINQAYDSMALGEAYMTTFMDKGPFECKIMDYKDSVPQVELKNKYDELIYEELINKKMFFLE